MDIQKMMQEAQKLQQGLNKVQEELANIEVTGESGGGAVTITMNAQGSIKDIKIKKEVVNPENVETLEDLILAALKDGTTKAVQISQDKVGSVTGGMGNLGIPGM